MIAITVFLVVVFLTTIAIAPSLPLPSGASSTCPATAIQQIAAATINW
jgi:hypothetical protein